MKVRSFRAPRLVIATWAQVLSVCRGSKGLFYDTWPGLLAFALAAIAIGLFLFHYDARLLASLHKPHFAREDSTMHVAAFLGTWGDYPTYNLPLALILWIYGSGRRSSAWRRLAVVCFLGGTLAGLFDDCFRLTLGRPRPDAHMLDGFYGLHDAWHSRFQSFPSGHAAAVFGTATALFFTRAWLGWMSLGFALVVIWARMELYRHYPSDVVVGAMIGMACGWLIGAGARFRTSQRP